MLASWATPDVADVWIMGNGAETTNESVKELQFAMLFNATIYDMMDWYHTHLDGLTSDEQFASAHIGIANLLQQPGMRPFWNSSKEDRIQECPKFIAWGDSLLSADMDRVKRN